jgi:hypothetical protein
MKRILGFYASNVKRKWLFYALYAKQTNASLSPARTPNKHAG